MTGSTRSGSKRRSSASRGSTAGQAHALGRTGFLADLKEVLLRYHKRTSLPHKRLVLFLVLAGAALRACLLLEPITAAESYLWVHYALRPVSEIISDTTHPENQVFHTLLVKLVTGLFGLGKITLRLPAYLAGVLAMPLFYLFVRAMFNRYIALMALALVAGSGALIEQGAVANGHALVCFFTILAFVLGRHFLKENSPVSAVAMGLSLALGLWATPGGLYPALMVLLWSLFHILIRHSESVPGRILYWFGAFGTFFLLTLVLYAPVINHHDLGHLFKHSSLPELPWKKFKLVHTEGAMAFWFHVVDTGSRWFAILGFIGVVVAAYISVKYRMLVAGMLLGAVVPVLIMRHVPGPEVWTYSLFIFHLSTAIVLFYALKYIQEKVLPTLGKRTRVAAASVLLLAATAWPAMVFLLDSDRLLRFPEAETAAFFLDEALDPEDRVHAERPWKDPLLFHLMCQGWGTGAMQGRGPAGRYLYVVVDPGTDQSLQAVLAAQGVSLDEIELPEVMIEDGRIKVYAARLKAIPQRDQTQ